MSIYKPSELRQFLQELGLSPKKGLSQNFLIDGNILRKIVSSAHVQPGDLVLEIGSGPGSLTQALLNAGATVLAVEKDSVLAEALNRLQTQDQRLTVVCDDILKFPLIPTLSKLLPAGKKAKLIANLPYHLTTPILALFAPLTDYFFSLTVMVQEEVARRITALPGSKDFSSLTIFLNFYTHPSYAFFVSHHCFYPPPKVDSAIVHLVLHEPSLKENSDKFFKITRTAFEHRRKMLKASLKDLYPAKVISQALVAVGLNPLARPEELGLKEFLELYYQLET